MGTQGKSSKPVLYFCDCVYVIPDTLQTVKPFNHTLGFALQAGLFPQNWMRFSQMGEGLLGRIRFIRGLPFGILLSKFTLFLLNSWNFLIPCDLSTCINLSRYKTSVAWKVLNLEYATESVFWVIKGSKPEKRITKRIYDEPVLNQQRFQLSPLSLLLWPG